MKKNKRLALELICQKFNDPSMTYQGIMKQTGFSKRQLIRFSMDLKERDIDSLLIHANTGKKPAITASDQEISYLRILKETYPNITIAQFRDIYIEDVIENPKMKSVVVDNSLVPRSISWFRNLFKREGWKSPAQRKARRDGRSQHTLRPPSPSRGMLIQIDGTPFDWFNSGELWTLHLAVDDATSEVLAGYFLPTERQLGYCIIVKMILEKYGIPMAFYSDRHSIFRNAKDDSPTQFGMMMESLGIELILANTSQAKGRVERYNRTTQLRLVNDIIRFNIKDYDELNIWFNSFYIPYLNKKFSFIPTDPNDAFVLLDPNFDLSTVFYLRYTRIIKQDMFSINNCYYSLLESTGEIVHIINGTKVIIGIDVFTNETFALRYGKKHPCVLMSDRKRKKVEIMNNQKDVMEYLDSHRKSV